VIAIGYSLPVRHVAARAITLRQRPADVYALIADFKNEPAWRSDLQQVEILPDRDGRLRFREKSKQGVVTMEVVESNPPKRLVTRIDDKTLPFGGTWTFDISPVSDGSKLNITEHGEVYNPVFRFVSRFIFGYTGTMDTYLKSVARKFGESSAPANGMPTTP
jgi:uncharacterized protein YndB with AHSA1/START domain